MTNHQPLATSPTVGYRYEVLPRGDEYLCPTCFLAESQKPDTYLGDDTEVVTEGHFDDRIISCAHCGKDLNT